MTPDALLADMRRRGVACVLAEGRLRVIASPGVLTDADGVALRAHRTALVALLVGAEQCDDLSIPPATPQRCNGPAENGDSELELPLPEPLQSPLQRAGHCNTPAGDGAPRAVDRCSTSTTATVAATPEMAALRVQNEAPEGGPLQCCGVADPLEVLGITDADPDIVLRVVAEGGRVDRADVVRWVRQDGLTRERARAYLDRTGPVTVDDVAQRLRVSKATALAAVRELAASGAIERCPFPVGGTGLWRPTAVGGS